MEIKDMSERIYKKMVVPGLLAFSIFIIGNAMGQEKRMRAWETPRKVMPLLSELSMDLEPTLPAPRLMAEPPFTWGESNTVYWYGDSVRAQLADLGMHLLFFEIKAGYNQTDLWGFVESDIDSATFEALPTGISIEYRLRYFAQGSDGAFHVSHWSEPTWSIQDNTPPMLKFVEILNLQESGDTRWVNSATIQIHVQAVDRHGQIMQVVLREKSDTFNEILFHAIVPPKDSIDVTVPYTIRSPEHMPITLYVSVMDVSGQEIGDYSQTLFWWEEEVDDDKMICFPNPFNPENDGRTIIKVANPLVTEARIFDPFGNLIRILQKNAYLDEFFEWDGRNGYGKRVATGGYLCVTRGSTQLHCKIAVLR